jgi:hypothetical protein
MRNGSSCCGRNTQLPKVMTGTTTVGTMSARVKGFGGKANGGKRGRGRGWGREMYRVEASGAGRRMVA